LWYYSYELILLDSYANRLCSDTPSCFSFTSNSFVDRKIDSSSLPVVQFWAYATNSLNKLK
ncbi:hypothetical protein BgiBS90_027326, partial [Biomphalaria glabrata]